MSNIVESELEVCTKHRKCAKAEYTKSVGNETTDTACRTCGAGKYRKGLFRVVSDSDPIVAENEDDVCIAYGGKCKQGAWTFKADTTTTNTKYKPCAEQPYTMTILHNSLTRMKHHVC